MAESKHARFVRLIQSRLIRAKQEMRLISQLTSTNYENTPEEAVEVVRLLDEDVRYIAGVFGVEYATRLGKSKTETVEGASPIVTAFVKPSSMGPIEIIRVLELLRAGNLGEAEAALRAAVTGVVK